MVIRNNSSKIASNLIHLLGSNHRILLVLPGKLERICPHGSHLGAGEGPVDAAGEVTPEVGASDPVGGLCKKCGKTRLL